MPHLPRQYSAAAIALLKVANQQELTVDLYCGGPLHITTMFFQTRLSAKFAASLDLSGSVLQRAVSGQSYSGPEY